VVLPVAFFQNRKNWSYFGILIVIVLFTLYQYLKPADLSPPGTTLSDEVLFHDIAQICRQYGLDGSSNSIVPASENDRDTPGLKSGEKYLQISSNYEHWWQDDKVPYEVYTAFAAWKYLSDRQTETPFHAIRVIYRPRSIVQVPNAYVFLTREEYMKVQRLVEDGDPKSMAKMWMELTNYKMWYLN
jgi:hypothetical protein